MSVDVRDFKPCNYCGTLPGEHDWEGWDHFEYWDEDPVICEECGACDCADDERLNMLCKAVGECSGLRYDVYMKNNADVLCDRCYELMVDETMCYPAWMR
jgi:hypothetical protein